MQTVGVDLSAETKDTWVATIEWTAGGARLVDLQGNVRDEQIVDAAQAAAKVGIDCPFGWPDLFVDFVTQHRNGDVGAQGGIPKDWRRNLANRVTDLAVRTAVQPRKLNPLSVSADRIAHTAFRCAALLARLKVAGVEVDRSGVAGTVVEIYPAASLLMWNLPHGGYKGGTNAAVLAGLVCQLLSPQHAPWLDLGPWSAMCRENDDAFDAVVAALSARAAARGLAITPNANQLREAKTEGWIAVPVEGSLAMLVSQDSIGA